MAKPRKRDPQTDAHELLQEWASGRDKIDEHAAGGGEEAGPVQRERSWLSAPERYAVSCGRWERLDGAVGVVDAMNRDLGKAIREHYGRGVHPEECAAQAGLTLRAWQERLRNARACFLAAYMMSCRHAADGNLAVNA